MSPGSDNRPVLPDGLRTDPPTVPDRVGVRGDEIWRKAWADGFIAGMGLAFRMEDPETARLYAKQELLIIRMLAKQFVFADITCRYVRRYASPEAIDALLANVSEADGVRELFGFDAEDWLKWPSDTWATE